jgi:membrane fusion protein, multidrug efflux system
MRDSAEVAKSALKSISEIEGYLEISAPSDGVVTERNVHPGSLMGPGIGPVTTAPWLLSDTK